MAYNDFVDLAMQYNPKSINYFNNTLKTKEDRYELGNALWGMNYRLSK